MKKRIKTVSVSELSAYAESPVRFCEAKGGAYDKSAVKYGDKAHNEAGKSYVPLVFFIITIMLVGGYLWMN